MIPFHWMSLVVRFWFLPEKSCEKSVPVCVAFVSTVKINGMLLHYCVLLLATSSLQVFTIFEFQPWSIQRLRYPGTTVIRCTALTFNTSQEVFWDLPPVELISRSGLGLFLHKRNRQFFYLQSRIILSWLKWNRECGRFLQQFNSVVVCGTCFPALERKHR